MNALFEKENEQFFLHELRRVCGLRASGLALSRHPVGYEVLVCSKALLGVILGVSVG